MAEHTHMYRFEQRYWYGTRMLFVCESCHLRCTIDSRTFKLLVTGRVKWADRKVH